MLTPKNIAVVLVLLAVILGGGIWLRVPLPTIQLPAEKIPGLSIFGFPITNTWVATLLADLTLLGLAFAATRKMQVTPSGLQNFAEWVYEGFHNFARQIAGENVHKFFPLFMTIFLFLVIANWWELIPGMDAIGIIEHPQEKEATAYQIQEVGPLAILTADKAVHEKDGFVLVPFLRAATTDLNLPLALAIISVLYTQLAGIQAQGLRYFSKFFVNPLKNGIGAFVGILELLSEFIRVISLSFRLFGNILAGQVLLFIIPFLLPFLIPLPFYGLEVFVGFMQAFIFAVLTLIFASLAVVGHEEGHH